MRLKKCPFCGSKAKFRRDKNNEGEWIECTKCMASTSIMFPFKDDVRELLYEKWNLRKA